MQNPKEWNYASERVEPEKPFDIQALTADYVRLEVHPADEKNKKILLENQYIWADRTIKASIDLQCIENNFARLKRMDIREIDRITDEVYEIAENAFRRDRRFFISVNYEREIGRRVLKDYIIRQTEKNCIIFGCFYEEKLIGILITTELDSHTYETVLGAILPEWHAKGAGISLYAFEFYTLKKRGVQTLYSRISTDNIASLNLHLLLSKGNIRFMEPFDIYLKNKGENQ